MAGLYIHIPFCKSRCIYCGFYSSTMLPLRERYVDALCREMELRSQFPPSSYGESKLKTVYLGGGTPSLLTREQLQKLFLYINKVYGMEECGEVTIECNPDDVTDDFVDTLRLLPVNRVSMGAQTFSNERLRFLHRRHNAHQVSEAVERLRKGGIGNISIDLMFGFPQQSLQEWQQDIRQAIDLGVEHISAYSLMYEEETELYRLREKGLHEYAPVSDELAQQMFETLTNLLTENGFEHYEISNFARLLQNGTSWRSRHNSSYWQGIPYIGIGAAAHSYDIHTRSWNVSDINAYIAAIENNTLPSEQEVLDDQTRYNDLITTAMRTREGICLQQLSEPFKSYLLKAANRSIQQGLLQIDNHQLHLTRKGIFISDDIMSDLIYL